MASLFLVLALCVSARAAHHGPTVHQRMALGAQRRLCDNGSGEACYAYAKMLRTYDHGRGDEATFYLRKSCQMSFKPACAEPAPVRRLRHVK